MKTYKINYLGKEIELTQNENGKFEIPQFVKEYKPYKYGLQVLKPALEPIGMFQKPHLKPMIKNVEKWGVGALHIDACRVEPRTWEKDDTLSHYDVNIVLKNLNTGEQIKKDACAPVYASMHQCAPKIIADMNKLDISCLEEMSGEENDIYLNIDISGKSTTKRKYQRGVLFTTLTEIKKTIASRIWSLCREVRMETFTVESISVEKRNLKQEHNKQENIVSAKRFPANLLHDGSDVVEEEFKQQSEAMGMHGAGKEREGSAKQVGEGGLFKMGNHKGNGVRLGDTGTASRFFYCAKSSKSERGKDNRHPTCKPIKLMEWLIKLVTPKELNSKCLDPFMGSGTTGIAAKKLGFEFIGIEKEEEYFEIAKKRIG